MTEAAEVFGNLGMVWICLMIASAVFYKASDYIPRYERVADCLGVIAILWMAPTLMIPMIFYT